MGVQDKGDVTLIRHAYVRTSQRNKGIGGTINSWLTGSGQHHIQELKNALLRFSPRQYR